MDMRQLCWMMGLGVLVLSLAAGPARAVTYEDSFEQCNYPKTFDLLILRPISLLTIVAGSVLFVPLAPMALLTVPGEMGTVYDNLVGAPTRFTFDRKLGECNSMVLSY
jgi:hypothetical protein